MADQMPPEALAAFNEQILTIRVYTACLLTWMVWEHIVTLEKEYKLFWKAPWTVMKALFLALRYWGLATMMMIVIFYFSPTISPEQCKKVQIVPGASSLGVILLVGAIFACRVWALWEKQLWVLIFFGALLCAQAAVSIWSLMNTEASPVPTAVSLCITRISPNEQNNVWAFWLCPVIFDAFVLIFTVAKSAVYYDRAAGSLIPLVRRMLKDGLAYYAVTLGVNIFTVVWFRSRGKFGDGPLHAPLSMACAAIACARLCMRLKDANDPQDSSGGTGTTSSSRNRRYQLKASQEVYSGAPSYQLDSLRTSNVGSQNSRPNKSFTEKDEVLAVAV